MPTVVPATIPGPAHTTFHKGERVSARIRRAVAVCAFGAATLGAAGVALGAGSIVDGEDQAPPILNNSLADGNTVVGQRTVGGTILENLFTANSKGAYIPLLATKIPSGSDVVLKGRKFQVTFNIQPAAKWSDGKPVTADDVIFTWKTYMNKNNQVSSRTGWEEIKSISKKGSKQFTVVFKRPYAPWADIFSISGGYYIYPKHILNGKDFNTVWNNGGFDTGVKYIGSGPYLLQSYRADEEAVLVKNTRYWGKKKPVLDKITLRYLGSTTAPIVQLKSGEINITNPPPNFDLFPQIRAIPNAKLQSRAAASWEQLAINVTAAPMNDPAVRQAFAYAIDRKGVADDILAGQVQRLDSALVPLQFGYKPSFAKYTYQPAKAKAILTAAGWNCSSTPCTKGGQSLRIEVKTTTGNTQRQKNIAYWAAKAKEAGFDLVYTPEPASKLFGGTLTNGDFVVANFAFSGSFDPSLTSILAARQVPTQANGFAGQNYYRYTSADGLLNASDEAVDPTKRKQDLFKLQDKLAKDVPFLPLYARPNSTAHQTRLRGPDVNPTQAEIMWNVNTWTVGAS